MGIKHTNSTIEKIRHQTAVIHHSLEQLPFTKAIVEETLHQDCYIFFLQQLMFIHYHFEKELKNHPLMNKLYGKHLDRTDLIAEDLSFFKATMGRASHNTQQMVAYFQNLSQYEPLALAGSLYVFEGSRLGSAVLQKHLRKSFQLPPYSEGMQYHAHGLKNLKRNWINFCENLHQFATTHQKVEKIATEAKNTMMKFYSFYKSLPVYQNASFVLA